MFRINGKELDFGMGLGIGKFGKALVEEKEGEEACGFCIFFDVVKAS